MRFLFNLFSRFKDKHIYIDVLYVFNLERYYGHQEKTETTKNT